MFVKNAIKKCVLKGVIHQNFEIITNLIRNIGVCAYLTLFNIYYFEVES